jgi:hypothetical protein
MAESDGGSSQLNEDRGLAVDESVDGSQGVPAEKQGTATSGKKRSTAEMLEQARQDLAKVGTKVVRKIDQQK